MDPTTLNGTDPYFKFSYPFQEKKISKTRLRKIFGKCF